MIEQALFSYICNEVGMIYPSMIPAKVTYPAMVYSIVTESDQQSLQRACYTTTYRIQIDIYAKSYQALKQYKQRLKEALYRFEYFPHALNGYEGYESDTALFRQTLDFKIIL